MNQNIVDRAIFKYEYSECTSRSKHKLLDSQCNISSCNIFTADDVPFSQILVWIIVGCALLTFICLVLVSLVIYKFWLKSKRKIDGWPWKTQMCCWTLEKLKCFPEKLVVIVLLIRVIIALPMDFIDIMSDFAYFYQISYFPDSCETTSILDQRIRIADFVYWILFAFTISGVLKHFVLLKIAYKKIAVRKKDPTLMPSRIRRVDIGESRVMDRNAYMEFTFLQGVFAFLFEDAAGGFIQFQYVDKYLVHVNKTVLINAMIMTIAALRLMYVFTRYIYQYWDSTDRLSLKLLHCIMLFTFGSVVVFQACRILLIIGQHNPFADEVYLTPMECFEYNEQLGLFEQTPFAEGCWSTIDYVFTGFIILAAIGVIVCLSLIAIYGVEQFRIFTQASYATRTAIVGTPTINTIKVPLQNRVYDPRTTHLMSRQTQAQAGKLLTDDTVTMETVIQPQKY